MTISQSDIEDQSQNPKKVMTEEGTVEERSVDEIIKADQYGSLKGLTRVPWGMRIARTKPRGTV